MIADFSPTSAERAVERAGQLMSDVWSAIPADLPTEQALRIAQTTIDILATPSDAEFEATIARALHLALVLGLIATIAYALLHDSRLAWAGAAAFTSSAAIYALYLAVTEPGE